MNLDLHINHNTMHDRVTHAARDTLDPARLRAILRLSRAPRLSRHDRVALLSSVIRAFHAPALKRLSR